jgi:hypothetical protein
MRLRAMARFLFLQEANPSPRGQFLARASRVRINSKKAVSICGLDRFTTSCPSTDVGPEVSCTGPNRLV